jgi:phosphatidate cytidylyltransferase
MLKQRVITALVLVAVLVPILFYLPEQYAVAAFSAIAALAGWEWSRLTATSTLGCILFPLWILICCVLCLLFPGVQLWLCILASGFWFAVPLLLVKRGKVTLPLLQYLIGTIVLIPAWIGMVQLHAIGPWILLAAMALVWVADIAAYFVGRAFGRHKLAPAVSPGKTWEGAGGAVMGALLYVVALKQFTDLSLPSNPTFLLLGTVLLVVVSIVGDLFESMIKRQAGVKDSSQLLPGHGGVLDRIDSLTAALPVMIAVLGVWKL